MRWGSAAALMNMSSTLCNLLKHPISQQTASSSSSGRRSSGGGSSGGGSGSSSKASAALFGTDSGSDSKSNSKADLCLSLGHGFEPFPVLLLHDPKDQITEYKGSKLVSVFITG
jgi:hypothetical protein